MYRRPSLRLVLSANTAYYNGDLTNRWADNTRQLGLGVGLVQTMSPRVSMAYEISYFRLEARDIFPARNFAFTATNALTTVLLRYNLLPDRSLYIGQRYRRTPLLIFAEAGLGALINNPEARQGIERLAPEPRTFFPSQVGVLPVGGGLMLRPSGRLAFTLEGLYFFTTTDQLDGVSLRGNPDSNDQFATGSLKMEITLGRGRGKPLAHGAD